MNITYLFGAGASAKALPVVNQIPQAIEDILIKLNEEEFNLSDTEKYISTYPKTKKQIKNELMQEFNWLKEQCKNHASIDTFAKKLFLQKNNDFSKLKTALATLFTLIQLNKPVDNRYDAFFASILINTINDFPKNIKIVSWNYDYQFEKAYSEYCESNSISAISAMLKINTRFSNSNIADKGFAIFKLNGGTQLLWKNSHGDSHFIDEVKPTLIKESLEIVLNSYACSKFFKDIYCGLSFAWEDGGEDFINTVINATKDTNVLVVIGYSFPYFNREIDRKIIRAMKLRKVYFQSPEADIIQERFQSIVTGASSPNELVPFKDCEQFMLPNEL
jgi:hypothetical protein